ncbi:hypothetical protein TWF481_008909 [Arthrobotrys musiformis]|uniref:CHCH domain-containing protein n=1 Tax=Arthrobotrys musiformis TaxID=47236 RepID=A0AAV9W4T4_9PEZI
MQPRNDSKDDDEWDIRIEKTGCAAENESLQMCFDRTKDWRVCQKELAQFKDCWRKHLGTKELRQTQIRNG